MTHPILATLSLGLALWTGYGAQPNPVILIVCFPIAIVLLLVFKKLGFHIAQCRPFWLGLLILPLLKIPTTLASLKEIYYAPHQQRHADLSHLTGSLSLFPQTIFENRPQRYHIRALNTESLSVHFQNGPTLEAKPLGNNQFYFDLFLEKNHPLFDQETAQLTLKASHTSKTLTLALVQAQVRPRNLSVNQDRTLALATSAPTDEGILISPEGDYRTFATGNGPSAAVFSDSLGQLIAVSHRYGDGIWWINSTSGICVDKTPISARLNHLAISSDHSLLAAIGENPAPIAILIDPQTKEITDIPLPAPPEWISFGRSAHELVISSRQGRQLWILQKKENTWHITKNQPLLRPLTFLKVSPSGQTIWGGSTIDDITSEDSQGNHRIVNSLIRFDLESQRFLKPWITEGRTRSQISPGSYDLGIMPMGIDFLKNGSIRTTFSGTHEVLQYDSDGQIQNQIPTAEHFISAPHDIAHFNDHRWLVASPVEGTIGIFDRQNQLLTHLDFNAPDPFEPDPSPLILDRRLGEIAFHESTLAGISCQSCHLHGDSDYAFHDIGGNQPVATLSAKGIAGTAPYLRDASYPQLEDLHNVATELYRGYQHHHDEEKHAHLLAQYLKAQPKQPHPNLVHKESNFDLKQGAQIFQQAGCATCHPAPAYTNLASLPAQRLFPNQSSPTGDILDTPSLIGLHSSAPYLHDGRAATLLDIFENHNSSNQHGDTKNLSSQELQALILFLQHL